MDWKQMEKEQLVVIENWNLRHKIYYLRESDGSVMCGVVIYREMIIPKKRLILARGVSFCNPRDTLNKTQARTLARGRAIRAFKKGKSSSVIKPRLMADNRAFNFTMFRYKSEYHPEPSFFEEKLLKEKEES